MFHVPFRIILAVALFVTVALSGCFGGEARTEWAFDVTQLDDVYHEGKRGAGVVVAVLDTGVDVDHPALDHLVNGDKSDGELIAFKDYLHGREGVDEAYDDEGHGSHVIGIMAGKGSSFGDRIAYGGVDLRGGAPDIQLVVAKVCGTDSCKESAIPDAIDWAVNAYGAQIVSLSLGGREVGPMFLNDAVQTETEQAIADAIDKGVVVVAAAGNDGTDGVAVPADIPAVIAVGAVDKDLKVAEFSNRGDNQPCQVILFQQRGNCDPNKKPELVAPGVDILSAWRDGKYATASGTSQATPFVTSVVAVMLEDRPPLTTRAQVLDLKEALVDTAKPIPGQATPHDDAAGYGLVQAKAALQAYR